MNYELKNAVWTRMPEALRTLYVAKRYMKKHDHFKTGAKVKIAFIIQRTELFNSVRTLVDAIAADSVCDLYFIPVPREIPGKHVFDTASYPTVVDFCIKQQKGTVLPGYDNHTGEYWDMKGCLFDYIFINTPYSGQYPLPLSFDNLSNHGKLCYVSYGYTLLEKHLPPIYSNRLFAENISFIFASNNLEYSFGQKYLRLSEMIGRKKLYYVGFPRFDLVKGGTGNEKTVLWTPRYTTNIGKQARNEQSSFLIFYKSFLKFAKEHPDFSFTVRPHPLMFDNFLSKGVMTKEEIVCFKTDIYNTPNIMLDESSDYLETLNKSAILMADYSSMVAEYYVSGRPIVYFGPKKDFSEFDSDMYDTFYTIETWEEAKSRLLEIMAGIDPKKEQREICVGEFLKGKDRNAGKAILDVILHDYYKNNPEEK